MDDRTGKLNVYDRDFILELEIKKQFQILGVDNIELKAVNKLLWKRLTFYFKQVFLRKNRDIYSISEDSEISSE